MKKFLFQNNWSFGLVIIYFLFMIHWHDMSQDVNAAEFGIFLFSMFIADRVNEIYLLLKSPTK